MGDQIYQVFCGNFEYDAGEREIERMFARYGRVERVDMKTGFAFVYMTDKRDAEDAIRGLDRREFGYKRRKLRVEWAKVGDRGMRMPPVPAREDARRRSSSPTATLFVVNFDVRRTRQRDLERHFDAYGRLKRVDIKRSYAFVEYESVDSAVDAQRDLDGSNLMGRNITVEFVTNEDPHSRRNQESAYRSRSPGSVSPRRDRSPRPRSRSRSRSSLRDASPKRDISRSRSRSRGRSYSRSRSRSRSRSPRR